MSWSRVESGGGEGGFAVTNAGSNIMLVKSWKDGRQENVQKQSVPTAGKSFRQNGEQGNNGGSAVTRAGSNGGRRITKRIPVQMNRRRHVQPVEYRCRGSKKARNIAVGFVTCWRWTRHMWKGPASGAAGRLPPPLGWSGSIAAGNVRQQAGTLCGDFTKAATGSVPKIPSYGWKS